MLTTKLTLQERRSIAAKPSEVAAQCFRRADRVHALLSGAQSEELKIPGIDGTVSLRRLDLGAFRGWVAEKDGKGLFIRENGETLTFNEFKKKAGAKVSHANISGDIDSSVATSIERNLHRNNIAFDKQLLNSVFERVASRGEKLSVPSRTGDGILDASINEKGNLVVRELPKESGYLAYHIEIDRGGTIIQGRVGEKMGARIEPYDRKPGYKDLGMLLHRLTDTAVTPS